MRQADHPLEWLLGSGLIAANQAPTGAIMSRLAFLPLTVAIAMVASGAAHAQSRIKGRVVLRPPVEKSIDVVLELTSKSTGDTLKQILVDQESPYRFGDVVPAGFAGDVVIVVKVRLPEKYASWQGQYLKRACCEFNQDIILKRPEDIYLENLERGRNAGTADLAASYFTNAALNAETLGQTLEVHRALAGLYRKEGQFAQYQDALDAVYDNPEVLTLTPGRKLGYWNERLDGMLWWTNFEGSPLPERDFGRKVAERFDTLLLSRWKKLLVDFKVAYPSSSISPAAFEAADVTEQLRGVLSTLGRKPEP